MLGTPRILGRAVQDLSDEEMGALAYSIGAFRNRWRDSAVERKVSSMLTAPVTHLAPGHETSSPMTREALLTVAVHELWVALASLDPAGRSLLSEVASAVHDRTQSDLSRLRQLDTDARSLARQATQLSESIDRAEGDWEWAVSGDLQAARDALESVSETIERERAKLASFAPTDDSNDLRLREVYWSRFENERLRAVWKDESTFWFSAADLVLESRTAFANPPCPNFVLENQADRSRIARALTASASET